MKRNNVEQLLQISVAQYLRVALRPPTWWSAIGHGGGGKVRGAILKSMGVRAGVPDLLVMHPAGLGHRVYPVVLWIEFKAPKGTLSAEQKIVREAVMAAGCHFVVCKSLDDVSLALRAFGIPLHATTTREAA